MNHVHNDAITCIIDKVEYLDILNFSETCKRFESIRSLTIFRKKKNMFYNLTSRFQISDLFNFLESTSYVSINGSHIAGKEMKFISEEQYRIKFYLSQKFFAVLGYEELKFPFVWPLHLLERIKYWFPDFDTIKIQCSTCSKCFYCLHNIMQIGKMILVFDKPLDTREYFINQVRMLYHVFRYFKNDIIGMDENK